MKKGLFVTWIAVAAAAGVLAGGCGSADGAQEQEAASEAGNSAEEDSAQEDAGEELITLRVGVMSGNTSHWYAEIGVETGIYEAHGLNVEITEYAAGIYTVDALVTGQIDIGNVADFAGINRIGSTADVTDLRFISQYTHAATSYLYVNPDRIASLSDLEGKNILTLRGTAWEYWNGKTVQAAGLTEDDITYVAVESAQDGIAVATTGDADAFWGTGEVAEKLEALGWSALVSQEELGMWTYEYYMSVESYITANQETLERFFAATDEIIAYIAENEEEAADIIYDATGLDQETFRLSNGDKVNELAFTQAAYDDLADVNEWAYASGYYDGAYRVEDFIDTTALAAYNPALVSWEAR